jgi:MFS family permease
MISPSDGRRSVYLWSLPVFVFGALGVSMATQIPSLLFFRFLQGLGAAPGLVLGPGVIGDIYRLEERGRAMSVFLSVSPHLDPCIFPILILKVDMFTGTRISTSSWRYVRLIRSTRQGFTKEPKVRLRFIPLGGSCNFIWPQLAFFNSAGCIYPFQKPPNQAPGVSINYRRLMG